jgi:hypothetical protein
MPCIRTDFSDDDRWAEIKNGIKWNSDIVSDKLFDGMSIEDVWKFYQTISDKYNESLVIIDDRCISTGYAVICDRYLPKYIRCKLDIIWMMAPSLYMAGGVCEYEIE